MSLPFLRRKNNNAGLITEYRAKDESSEPGSDYNPDSGIEACGEDIIRAVNANDKRAVAAALKAAFQLLSSAPAEEEDSSYSAQNELAAKERR